MSEELKARIAELERAIARADRLAEAASIVEEFYDYEVEPSDESMMALMEALAAYRNGGDDE